MKFFKKFLVVLASHAPAELVGAMNSRRVLDQRLEELTKATVNGEEQWFLQLVKRDPGCAINVIKECDIDKNIE